MAKSKNQKVLKITPEIESFVTKYAKAIEDRTAGVFAGAGLSIPAGFVDWKGLLKNIAKEVGLNVDKEHDLIAVAQFHVNEKKGRHGINQSLVDEFSKKATLTENHRVLARLPIATYWTTNYDNLIETVLIETGKTPDVKITTKNLPLNIPMRDAVVYKMHGDASQPDEAVVTKDDYEGYTQNRQLFSTALQGDLLDKTFLFLGFSFNDPNIGYILGRIRVILGKDQREHFCIMRKVHRSDFKKAKEFSYAKVRQELQIRDLRRFAIEVLLVDRYEDVTSILKLLETRVKRKRVFISGSAATYEPYNEAEARQFIHDLSKALVKDGFEIVTGFGLGVGDAVINGALDHIFSTKYQSLDRFLIMRPFPQFSTGGKKLSDLWTEYRNTILDQAGIAIFLFGNKKDKDGNIVLANGIQEEFDIAVEKGMPVVPAGFTGHMAKLLWSQTQKNKTAFAWKTKGVTQEIARLEKPVKDLSAKIPKILNLIKRLQREGY